MTNAVKPSKREKKRYICFRFDGVASKQEIQEAILSRVRRWIGEKQFALGRVQFLSETFQNNTAIIACNHTQCPDVKAGILLVNTIGNHPVRTHIVTVSGTLKNAKRGIYGTTKSSIDGI